MADGVEEMRFAEPDSAVDEERVVRARRQLRDRLRRRLRELVRGPDDEGVERVARVETFDVGAPPRERRRGRSVCDAIGGGRIVHAMTPRYGVQVSNINDSYWVRHYYGAIRPRR